MTTKLTDAQKRKAWKTARQYRNRGVDKRTAIETTLGHSFPGSQVKFWDAIRQYLNEYLG